MDFMATDHHARPADRRGALRSRLFRPFQVALLVGCMIGLVLTVFLAQRFQDAETQIRDAALAEATSATRTTARAVAFEMAQLMPAVQSVADDLNAGRVTGDTIETRLEAVLRDLPGLFAAGVAFEPFAYRSDTRLHAPLIVREDGDRFRLHQVGQAVDYTEFKQQWYVAPLLDGATWSEPNTGRGRSETMIDYAVPFYHPGDDRATAAPAGIVYGGYALNGIKKLVDDLDINISGYQYIFTKQGRFITHPRQDLVRSGETIFEVALEAEDSVLFSAAIQAIKGRGNAIRHADPITGESALVVYEPIDELGWSVVTVVLTDEALDPDAQRRGLLHIMLSVLAAAAMFAIFAINLLPPTAVREWTHVVTLSALFGAGTAFSWAVTLDYAPGETSPREEIVNRSSLNGFLETYRQESKKLKADQPIFVPTGVFIQSVEFTTSNNVKITGYIWQKYQRGVHDDVSRGFVLPEAEEPIIREVYNRPLTAEHTADTILSDIGMSSMRGDCTKRPSRTSTKGHKGCSQLIGWYFSTVVRQNFSYSAYPFDSQYVWLRLWHKDFDRNIVLVPDLGSYKVTNPSALPGIETDFVLPGWELKDAAFSYERHGYNTNFGIQQYVGQENFPELYYNIHISRDFLGPFVLHFLPQFVVATMLFIVLLMGSKQGESAKWLGFASKDIVRACAMLIIVLIFAHSALRRTLYSASLVYLEYFYMMLYLSCLAVSFNAIFFAMGKVPILEYRDNFWPKVAYWPVLTGAAFLITLVSFY